jgi:hypothetical protein
MSILMSALLTPAPPEQDGIEAPARKRGRPAEFDWKEIENEITRIMDLRGDFRPRKGWNQAQLERELFEFCNSKLGDEPGITTLREHLVPCLNAWRKQRQPE